MSQKTVEPEEKKKKHKGNTSNNIGTHLDRARRNDTMDDDY